MLKPVFMGILAACIACGSAWAGDGSRSHDHSGRHPAGHEGKQTLTVTGISPDMLRRGEVNRVVFSIRDAEGRPIGGSQLDTVHTQPVHLLVIDPGLDDYHHEHPVESAPGEYTFTFVPKTACSYRVWVNVQLKGSSGEQYIPVDLKGAEDCDTMVGKRVRIHTPIGGYDFHLELDGNSRIGKVVMPYVLDAEMTTQTSAGGYDFYLKFDGPLKVGQSVMGHLRVSEDGNPVDFLEPVLGSFAHIVGFYEDYNSVVHIHPIGPEPSEASRAGPSVDFRMELEKAEYIKLFAQLKIRGKEVVAPFWVMVSK